MKFVKFWYILYCGVCGKAMHTRDLDLPMTHQYDVIEHEPTCTESGYNDNYVPATGHTWNPWVIEKAATATSTDLRKHTCVSCGIVESEIIPASSHNHSYSLSKTVQPTCTTDGSKLYVCSCGDSYTEKIPATGHSFGEWKVTRAATSTAAGVKERKCSKCGAVETQAIPKLNPQQTDVTLNNHDIQLNYKETSSIKASSENVKWSSSNAKVVTVDSKGNIKATGTGSAVITVTDTVNGTTDKCNVTVSYVW